MTEFADEAALIEAIRDREVYGGLVVSAGGPVVLTASAASTAAAQTLAALAPALSRDGSVAEVRDVVPLPADDPRGAGLAALVLPLVLGAIVPAAVLGSLHLRRRTLLAATVAYALVGGAAFAVVLHTVFGTLSGDFLTEALVLAAIVGASTLALVGLQWAAGRVGLGLGALLLALVGNPLSGASTAPEFLASPWREIGQAMPPGAGGQLVRSVAFFDGAQSAGPWWVLAAWAAAGLVLLALPRRRRRHTSAPEGKFLGGWRRSGACIARPTREGCRVATRPRRTPRGACLGGVQASRDFPSGALARGGRRP